jgi:signal transduction histidine kinase
MPNLSLIVIYFCYGLAFFSMGLMVAMEGGRSTDERLRMALRPLAGFGIVHAAHEWLEMFALISLTGIHSPVTLLTAAELCLLAFSFLSLAAFGSYLILGGEATWRASLLLPLVLETIWVFGLVTLKGQYPLADMPAIANVWTRYALGVPSALLAAMGLIVQQRVFRRAGLIRFGQDSLWAAIAFGWYGLIGQIFTQPSKLPPSTFLNENFFSTVAGFPIQLFRASMAIAASIFVIRFLRAFQVEADRKMAELQEARLQEAQQRETLKSELFRRIVSAQEAERQRIARDLHDETGQALTAIGMGLRSLADKLNPRNRAALGTLHHLQELTAHSLRELQRIISDLRPSHLDDLGLPSALRWYVGQLHEVTHLHIKLEILGEERDLDDASKIAIFRIIQEALNNVIKHANASEVDVFLRFRENDIHILVRDNGIGFDTALIRLEQRHGTSLGLAGMEERAALLGGTVNITSRPGFGTSVEVTIPYQTTNEVVHGNTRVAGR